MQFKKSNKIFVHIDCDSFFASCEILKNPSLKDNFVCVWEEIVVACTYNCKDLWIKTWTPVWTAKKILKDKWVFLKWDMWFYQEISKNLFVFLREKTLLVEEFSIDEAFCEITGIPEYKKVTLWKYLRDLQKEILDKIWVPVSIWCSETRIKAKIYSKLNKPYWIYIWFDLKREINLFKNLEIIKIPFIGKKTSEKLKTKAKTIYDFVQLWFWDLKQIIWKNATDLRLELVWVNAFSINTSKDSLSMSRSRSFNKNITNDKNFLHTQMLTHFDRLFFDLTQKNLALRKISVFFRKKSFEVDMNCPPKSRVNKKTLLFWYLNIIIKKYLNRNYNKYDTN